MIKNVLITGGAGFIGSNLARNLINKGYNVTVLDNLSPQIHGVDFKNSPLYLSIKDIVNFIHGDVLKQADWKKALHGQDVVVHLAAETGTGQSMYEINKYSNVNIQGTALLLDILANEKHSIKKVIVASSRAVYGEGKSHCKEHASVYPLPRREQDMSRGDFAVKCPYCGRDVEVQPTDEDSKLHPTSVYGITKQTQEQMVMTVGKSLGVPTVAFRYQNVYGPGQSLSNPYTGILSIFSTRIKNGNEINIFEDGKESRDFVYIDDVVEATVLGIEQQAANFEVFNVGYGVPIDVLSVAETLKSKYGSNTNIKITGNYRLGDIRTNYADLRKIQRLLGFKPKYDFVTGITKFTGWVDNQDIKDDQYEKSIQEMKAKGLYK